MMTQSYKVDGMTCGGCARAVTQAITGQAPDAKVSVDLPTGTVTVDGPVSAEAVKAAGEQAGFDFVGGAEGARLWLTSWMFRPPAKRIWKVPSIGWRRVCPI